MDETIEAFIRIVGRLTADDVVMDIGANVGDYTAKFAASGAQVHAFEPEPRLFACLKDRFSDFSNVFLYQAAIAAQPGVLKLWLENQSDKNPLDMMSHSIVDGGELTENGKAIDVDCIDFFSFLEGLEKVPALIKMDIEGADVEILERLFKEERFDQVGPLYVETHERQIAK
ncbi:FkbM family methyltransferase [Roseovarius aestuariivivens]|uniref:FkbM family methyltransferase n=1 Tax=Roseovarius aestuariivivens TaxID=1888910 RepID=UPI001436A2BF|nr:FkbM family methyltransferase [Roseovarius aestuariivivens]